MIVFVALVALGLAVVEEFQDGSLRRLTHK
jgi:hypothetical protein